MIAHAIAISLGALKAPEPEAKEEAWPPLDDGRPVPIRSAEDLEDIDSPDMQKFLHQLGAALG